MKKKVKIIIIVLVVFLIIFGIWHFFNREIEEGDTLRYKRFKDDIPYINVKTEIGHSIYISVKNPNIQKIYQIMYLNTEKPLITVNICDSNGKREHGYWYSWEDILKENGEAIAIPKGWSEAIDEETKCVPISSSEIEAINGKVDDVVGDTSIIRKFFKIF